MSKFLIFDPDEEGFRVLNKGTRAMIGKIYFYPHWKKFVFEPEPNSVFSVGCLEDIIWRMKFLRKAKK